MSLPSWLRIEDADVIVWVAARPGARRNEIVGVRGDRMIVRVAARPVDGAANRELCRFLAGLVHTSPSHVWVERGTSGSLKRLRLAGVEPGDVVAAVETAIAGRSSGTRDA